MQTDESMFEDFSYPDDVAPSGVFEKAMPDGFKAAIRDRAKLLRAGYSDLTGWNMSRWQCDRMADAWLHVLRDVAGLDPIKKGGIGDDHESQTTGFVTDLSGYSTTDGYVHWHYWLLIGPRLHVFDPTAYQAEFKNEWPMRLDGYIVEGRPLTEWRRTHCRP
jgi:hypothetical protein